MNKSREFERRRRVAACQRRIRNPDTMTNYAEAKEEPKKIFRQLERIKPSAARSLEEGLEETPTLVRLGCASSPIPCGIHSVNGPV